MRPRGALLLLSAAAVHLGLVVLGALHVNLHEGGWLRRAAAYYASLSGADSAYGFFAPVVSPSLFARFEVTGADGRVTSDTLESEARHEASFRVRNIVAMFRFQTDEALRRAIAASWAGKVLARHPGAEGVVVRVEEFALPSMEEARKGEKGRWELHYQARFVPSARLRAAATMHGRSP